MPLENAELQLRCLPDGSWHSGLYLSLVGTLLSVEIANGEESGFADGCLLEVNWDRKTYLGQLHSRQDHVLVIGVEHSVDSKPLSALQDAWRPLRS